MKTLIIGAGPVSALIHHTLSAGHGRHLWITGRDRQVLSRTLKEHGQSAGPDTVQRVINRAPEDSLVNAEIFRDNYDAVIIAQPPGLALDVAMKCTHYKTSEAKIFLSCNGFWWRQAKIQRTGVFGAICVTPRVVRREQFVLYSPPDSGYILGPACAYVEYFNECAERTGLRCVVAPNAESAVASKCLVNTPISLRFGVEDGTSQEVIAGDAAVLIEACQINELVEFTRRAGLRLVSTPGFDTLKARALSKQLMIEGPHDHTAITELRALLGSWRQDREPSIGAQIRRRDIGVLPELYWMWGNLLDAADEVGASMPLTAQLYQRVLSQLSGATS